tara:strand:+ start:1639 stop:2148 length:510 start_codon:yes stop_codon:yes gene_type:complete
MLKILKKLFPQKITQLVYFLEKDDAVDPVKLGITKSGTELRIGKFVDQGYSVHELIYNDEIVYSGKIFKKVHLLKLIDKYGSYAIGDCITAEKYRGKNIYPYTLQMLSKEMFKKKEELFILVSPENKASIRGIEKAGFSLYCKINTIRIGVFYTFKKIIFYPNYLTLSK